jgi:hypothetical protein
MGQIVLGALDPAYRTGRTIFPERVFDPSEVKRVLKDGHQSRKIGKFVTKGPRRGWPLFTLTLEERATCPRSCKAWAFCYGNNMQAAERIVAGPSLRPRCGTSCWRCNSRTRRLHGAAARARRLLLARLRTLWDFGARKPSRRCTSSASPRMIRRARSARCCGAMARCAMGPVRRPLLRLDGPSSARS